jgi:hypothetical protein
MSMFPIKTGLKLTIISKQQLIINKDSEHPPSITRTYQQQQKQQKQHQQRQKW